MGKRTIQMGRLFFSSSLTTTNANIHTNSSNIHKTLSIEYRADSPQSFVGLNTQDKARSEHIKISNGTGDPVMHGAVLGTVAVQTGILSSTGSGQALSLPDDNDYISIPQYVRQMKN